MAALLINICLATLVILLVLWLLNLVLARLQLPADILQVIWVIVAVAIIAMVLGTLFGAIPAWQPIHFS